MMKAKWGIALIGVNNPQKWYKDALTYSCRNFPRELIVPLYIFWNNFGNIDLKLNYFQRQIWSNASKACILYSAFYILSLPWFRCFCCRIVHTNYREIRILLWMQYKIFIHSEMTTRLRTNWYNSLATTKLHCWKGIGGFVAP